MEFNVKEWRKTYDEVHRLGSILKNSKKYWNEKKNCWYPPLAPLKFCEQCAIESAIANLIKEATSYLDSCGIKARTPLWDYDSDNKKTWASHWSFAYEHLYNKE